MFQVLKNTSAAGPKIFARRLHAGVRWSQDFQQLAMTVRLPPSAYTYPYLLARQRSIDKHYFAVEPGDTAPIMTQRIDEGLVFGTD